MPQTQFFGSVSKHRKKSQLDGLERNDPTQNGVKGLASSHLTTGWPHFK